MTVDLTCPSREGASSITSVSSVNPISQQVIDLADYYHRMPGSDFPDRSTFQRLVVGQYNRLPFRVEFVDHDPCRSLETMRVDMASTGNLKITTRNNDSLLDPQVNLMFRAVHDYDHIRYGCDFTAHVELRACRVITNRCGDEWGRALLFSEIVGQACVAVAFGKFGEQKYVPYPLEIRDRALKGA